MLMGVMTEDAVEMVAYSVQVFRSVLDCAGHQRAALVQTRASTRTAIAKFVPAQFVVSFHADQHPAQPSPPAPPHSQAI